MGAAHRRSQTHDFDLLPNEDFKFLEKNWPLGSFSGLLQGFNPCFTQNTRHTEFDKFH